MADASHINGIGYTMNCGYLLEGGRKVPSKRVHDGTVIKSPCGQRNFRTLAALMSIRSEIKGR